MRNKKCPHCGQTVQAENFCSECGKKMVEVCNCWVLNKPHNCGKEKCPGVRLMTAK